MDATESSRSSAISPYESPWISRSRSARRCAAGSPASATRSSSADTAASADGSAIACSSSGTWRAPPLENEPLAADVLGDRVQPRCRPRRRGAALHRPERVQERRLRDVFRLLGAPDLAEDPAVDVAVVLAVEALERPATLAHARLLR